MNDLLPINESYYEFRSLEAQRQVPADGPCTKFHWEDGPATAIVWLGNRAESTFEGERPTYPWYA